MHLGADIHDPKARTFGQKNFGPNFRSLIMALKLPENDLARKTDKNKGGGKLRGGENIPYISSPKTVLDPPTYDTIPPPLCSRNVILLRGNGHRPDKSHFLRPPKLVLEGVLYGTFPPPPQNRTIRFAPPPLRIPKLSPATKRSSQNPKMGQCQTPP